MVQETITSLVTTTLPLAVTFPASTGLGMFLLIHLGFLYNLTTCTLFFLVNLILRHPAELPRRYIDHYIDHYIE